MDDKTMLGRLSDQLKRHEGVELKPYVCPAGYLTIGVGRNIQDNGISMEEAEILLLNDIDRCWMQAKTLPGWDSMNEARRAVLVNMVFNMGLPRVQGFKKMLAALEDEDYAAATREMLDSRWARQVGDRATELAEQMAYGGWRQ